MRALSGFRAWLSLLLCISGCGTPPSFQVTTTVGPGGRTERVIVQPRKGYLPPSARPEGAGDDSDQLSPQWIAEWQSVEPAAEPPGKTEPNAKFDAKHPYFVARGDFPSPDKIPPHYRYQGSQAADAIVSELKREFSRTDFGLLVEYRWEEAVTNTVTLTEFLAARDKLLDSLLPVLVDEFNHSLTGKYHTKPLEGFVLGEGKQILSDISLVWYEACANRPSQGEFDKRVEAILQKHGLSLNKGDAKGSAKDNDMLEHVMMQILVTHLQHPDGKQVTADEAKAILETASNVDEDDALATEHRNQFDKAVETALKDAPIDRVAGAYPWIRIFGKPEQFDFTLELPGVLLETSGLIQAANRCRWRFTSVDTFPSGYRMTARSVAIEPETQRKLLGRVIVEDAAAAAAFIELVGREGPLYDAVNQAFASGKLDAIRDLNGTDAESRERVAKLQVMFAAESK